MCAENAADLALPVLMEKMVRLVLLDHEVQLVDQACAAFLELQVQLASKETRDLLDNQEAREILAPVVLKVAWVKPVLKELKAKLVPVVQLVQLVRLVTKVMLAPLACLAAKATLDGQAQRVQMAHQELLVHVGLAVRRVLKVTKENWVFRVKKVSKVDAVYRQNQYYHQTSEEEKRLKVLKVKKEMLDLKVILDLTEVRVTVVKKVPLELTELSVQRVKLGPVDLMVTLEPQVNLGHKAIPV